ncbi:MAG: lytic transglycosylase domain-containing protein, partial [Actinobacteria bacterium]|nr:lytic transglycosylase domain-containing protein [Actinomycetota bacterium]
MVLRQLTRRRTLVLATVALVAVPTTVVVTVAASGHDTPSPRRPVAAARSVTAPSPSVLSMSPWSIDGGVVLVAAPRTSTHAPPGAAAVATALAAGGIPQIALDAYRQAAAREARLRPGCHLSWPLLAAIGRVESDHGRFGGAVLRADGTSTRRIIGPALNGDGVALIRDTDHGRLDGDPVYDHAVGPMQFIPSTWASYGVDVHGPGHPDPFDIVDAAAAAADYLCVAGGDLATGAGQQRAVLAYNHSTQYLAEVLGLEVVYARGAGVVVPTPPA